LNLTGTSLKDPNLFLNAIPKTVTGTVTSISCEDKHKVVLQTPDGPQTFTSDGRVMVGYSDTFWWAGDHFNLCHQAPGIRAVLRYKPNTAKGDSLGDWTALELRDDLPAPPSTAASRVRQRSGDESCGRETSRVESDSSAFQPETIATTLLRCAARNCNDGVTTSRLDENICRSSLASIRLCLYPDFLWRNDRNQLF
jgi:hypothetical protein